MPMDNMIATRAITLRRVTKSALSMAACPSFLFVGCVRFSGRGSIVNNLHLLAREPKAPYSATGRQQHASSGVASVFLPQLLRPSYPVEGPARRLLSQTGARRGR